MDFSNNTVQLVTPIAPLNQSKNNKKDRNKQKYYIYPSSQKKEDNDQYIPNDYMSPNTFYNNKGLLYAENDKVNYKLENSRFKKCLTAELNKILDERTNNGPEYARTFIPVQDLYEYQYDSNRFKGLINDLNNYLDMNVRGTLLTSPAYGSDNSYSSYMNGNPRNEMYQKIFNNKPYQVVHTLKDLHERYFEPDTYTSIKPRKI